MNKRKFSKLLNKEVEYTATKADGTIKGNRVLLRNVKYEGKLYSDHVWVYPNEILTLFDVDTDVLFKATAYMYNDNFNTRKQGLRACNSYQKINHDYNNNILKENSNALQKKKRKNRG